MGKCKKGGGKAVSRNMENINNHRAWLKDTARSMGLEDLVRTYIYCDMDMFNAENYEDYVSNRINFPLVQSLVLCGSPVDDSFMDNFNYHITMNILKLGIFSHIKCLNSVNSYKPSVFNYIRTETVTSFNDFFPDLHKDAYSLYIKTLAILFEYEREFIESKFADVHKNKSWFESLYDTIIHIVIKDTYSRKMFSLIKENNITYDEIFSKFCPPSDEDRANRIKKAINDLVKPNYSRIAGSFNASVLFEYSNDVLKSFLSSQVIVCENAFIVKVPGGYVDEGSNLIKVGVCESDSSQSYYPFSYEMFIDKGNFGTADISAYVNIARMDLSGLSEGDIGPLKDAWYSDKLLDSLNYIDKWNISKMLREYLVHLRMNSLLEYRECELAEKSQGYESSIRALKSEIKSLKRENISVSNSLQKAEDTILEMNSRDSVLLKEGEVVVKSSEIDSLKSKIAELEGKLSDTQSALSKSVGKCEWQEKQISQLEEVVTSYDNYDKELLELRGENIYLSSIIEKMEDLNKEDVDVRQKRFEEQLSEIKDIPILFVGGIGDMMSKFKDIFPNSDYIDVSDEGVNFSVPPRFQYVVLYTRSITHPHCYRVESQVPRERIIFMSMSNTELVVDELYKRIVNGGYSEV